MVGAEVDAHDRRVSPIGVLGVDGCPGGWVAVLLGLGGLSWWIAADAAEVLAIARRTRAAVVGVDIPIGLAEQGPRECDRLTRGSLGARRSSVFSAPVRAVLDASSYDDACTRARAATGRALSLQTWHITPRIHDFDRLVTPAVQRSVVEVHPELSFRLMTGRELAPKRTPIGRLERTAALASALGCADPLVGLPRPAGPADGLDALACAWTARRWRAGTARLLPADPPRDARGRWMGIAG